GRRVRSTLEIIVLREISRSARNRGKALADLRFVDSERIGHIAGQCFCGGRAEASEERRRVWIQPAAGFCQPARRAAVKKCNRRIDMMAPAAFDHAFVIIDLGSREVSTGGLYSCPFNREPVGIESEMCQERDILLIPVIAVAGIA